jgi:hypothetical protein
LWSQFNKNEDDDEDSRVEHISAAVAGLVLGGKHEVLTSYNDGSAVYFREDYANHGGVADQGVGNWRCGKVAVHLIRDHDSSGNEVPPEPPMIHVATERTPHLNDVTSSTTLPDGSQAFTNFHTIAEGNGPTRALDKWNPNIEVLVGDFPWQSGKPKVFNGFGFDSTAVKAFADAQKAQTQAFYNQLTDAIQNGTYDTFSFQPDPTIPVPVLGPSGGFVVGDIHTNHLDLSGGSYWLRHVFTDDDVDKMVSVLEQDYNDGLVDITGPDYILYSPQSQKYLWPAMAQVRASQHIANEEGSDLIVPRNLIDRLQAADEQSEQNGLATAAASAAGSTPAAASASTTSGSDPTATFTAESSEYLAQLQEMVDEANADQAAVDEAFAESNDANREGYTAKAVRIPLRRGETYQHYLSRMEAMRLTHEEALAQLHQHEDEELFNQHGYPLSAYANLSEAKKEIAREYWSSAEFQQGGPDINLDDYDDDGNPIDHEADKNEDIPEYADEDGQEGEQGTEQALSKPRHGQHANAVFREGMFKTGFFPTSTQHPATHSHTHGHNGKHKHHIHKKHAKHITKHLKRYHQEVKHHHTHFHRRHHPQHFRGEGKKHREEYELEVFRDSLHPLHAEKRLEGQNYANAINNALQEKVISHEDTKEVLRERYTKYKQHSKHTLSFEDFVASELDDGFQFSWLIPKLHSLGLYPIDHTHRHVSLQSLKRGNWVVCGFYDEDPHAIAIHCGIVICSASNGEEPYMLSDSEQWPAGFTPVHFFSIRDTFPRHSSEITHDEDCQLEHSNTELEGRGRLRYSVRRTRKLRGGMALRAVLERNLKFVPKNSCGPEALTVARLYYKEITEMSPFLPGENVESIWLPYNCDRLFWHLSKYFYAGEDEEEMPPVLEYAVNESAAKSSYPEHNMKTEDFKAFVAQRLRTAQTNHEGGFIWLDQYVPAELAKKDPLDDDVEIDGKKYRSFGHVVFYVGDPETDTLSIWEPRQGHYLKNRDSRKADIHFLVPGAFDRTNQVQEVFSLLEQFLMSDKPGTIFKIKAILSIRQSVDEIEEKDDEAYDHEYYKRKQAERADTQYDLHVKLAKNMGRFSDEDVDAYKKALADAPHIVREHEAEVSKKAFEAIAKARVDRQKRRRDAELEEDQGRRVKAPAPPEPPALPEPLPELEVPAPLPELPAIPMDWFAELEKLPGPESNTEPYLGMDFEGSGLKKKGGMAIRSAYALRGRTILPYRCAQSAFDAMREYYSVLTWYPPSGFSVEAIYAYMSEKFPGKDEVTLLISPLAPEIVKSESPDEVLSSVSEFEDALIRILKTAQENFRGGFIIFDYLWHPTSITDLRTAAPITHMVFFVGDPMTGTMSIFDPPSGGPLPLEAGIDSDTHFTLPDISKETRGFILNELQTILTRDAEPGTAHIRTVISVNKTVDNPTELFADSFGTSRPALVEHVYSSTLLSTPEAKAAMNDAALKYNTLHPPRENYDAAPEFPAGSGKPKGCGIYKKLGALCGGY